MEKGYLKISGSLYWQQPCPTLGKCAFQQGNRAKQRVDSRWLPRQAGLIYAAAGEADFPVIDKIPTVLSGGKVMCSASDFIGLRTDDVEMVIAVSSALGFCNASNVGIIAV